MAVAAEPRCPELVGEDDDLRAAGLILVLGVPAADRGWTPNTSTSDAVVTTPATCRRAAAGHHERRLRRSAHRGEHLIAGLPVVYLGKEAGQVAQAGCVS